MRRGFLPIALVVLLSGYLLLDRVAPRGAPAHPAAAVAVQGGSVAADTVSARRAVILRHIEGMDTYLPAMLEEGDSILKRWQDRLGNPIRVHLPHGSMPGYLPEFHQAAEEAFGRWRRVGGLPVDFVFVRDPAAAEVEVRWVERLGVRRTGQAEVVWDAAGWIVRATLTLATRTPDGRQLTADAVYTVALHEIGHPSWDWGTPTGPATSCIPSRRCTT